MFDTVKVLSGAFLSLILGFFSIFSTSPAEPQKNKTPVDVKSTISTSTEVKITTQNIYVDNNPTSTQTGKTPPPTTGSPIKKTATKNTGTLPKNGINLAPTTLPVKEKESPRPTINLDKTNEDVRKTVVNILCTSKKGGLLEPISGSGVIIDSRGVILTNAHIGQYFLIKNYLSADFIDCVIRTGSPAYPQYKASLLYISPKWVSANSEKILEQEPTGTGEDDFALILATSTISGNPIPPLPHIPIQIPFNGLEKGDPIILVSFPAGFLGGINVQQNLYEASTFGVVDDLFTFKDKTLDLFSVQGSIVAQHGSSGGAIANTSGALIGIIATADTSPETGNRYLGAITIDYIDRDLKDETGLNLQSFLTGDINERYADFSTHLEPSLIKIMEKRLDQALK